MTPLLTFIIPVRHQDNAADWPALCARLAQTARSVANQTCPDWRAVVVANHGAALPRLPAGFAVERVGFAPNPLHDITAASRGAVYDRFRLDKGRRVLAGMLAAGPSEYMMIVDDDDFVSAGLVDHVSRHRGANGWAITQGWLWSERSWLAVANDAFNACCGTSHIVRSDLYALPRSFADASEDYIKTMLGSHVMIEDLLARRGTGLAALPFRGGIYRIGHSGAHSRSRGVVRTCLLNRGLLRDPRKPLGELRRFALVGDRFRREFFGDLPPARTRTRSPAAGIAGAASAWAAMIAGLHPGRASAMARP